MSTVSDDRMLRLRILDRRWRAQLYRALERAGDKIDFEPARELNFTEPVELTTEK
jgi:hypothetical protein